MLTTRYTRLPLFLFCFHAFKHTFDNIKDIYHRLNMNLIFYDRNKRSPRHILSD